MIKNIIISNVSGVENYWKSLVYKKNNHILWSFYERHSSCYNHLNIGDMIIFVCDTKNQQYIDFGIVSEKNPNDLEKWSNPEKFWINSELFNSCFVLKFYRFLLDKNDRKKLMWIFKIKKRFIFLNNEKEYIYKEELLNFFNQKKNINNIKIIKNLTNKEENLKFIILETISNINKIYTLYSQKEKTNKKLHTLSNIDYLLEPFSYNVSNISVVKIKSCFTKFIYDLFSQHDYDHSYDDELRNWTRFEKIIIARNNNKREEIKKEFDNITSLLNKIRLIRNKDAHQAQKLNINKIISFVFSISKISDHLYKIIDIIF